MTFSAVMYPGVYMRLLRYMTACSGVATDFRLGVSGRTVSQGNPYQKLKSHRILANIF